ncbi:MAG: type II toxin-antitoxin system ParD family antitoxin [Candidatus Binataceae bacterium]
MNVSLTPELEKIVAERVTSGRYASASEVIREALRLLEERDQLNQLRQEVRLGLEQLDQGRRRPFDTPALERIKRQGRERVAAALQPKDRAR